MPTPLGHSLAGLAIARVGIRESGRSSVPLYAATAFLACLPDIDLAIGFLIGQPRRFHHGPAHSLAFAIGIAILVAILLPRIDGRRMRVFMIAVAAVASHGLLDMLRTASTPRAGVQYLWPVSDRFLNLPWHVFNHAPELDQYSPAGAAAVLATNALTEILLIGPFFVLAVIWSRLRHRTNSHRLHPGS